MLKSKYSSILSFSLALVILLLIGAFTVSASVIYVNDSSTIQGAVDNATAGDTVIVRDGTYTENVDVDKSLTIVSENGSENCIVSASSSSSHIFDVIANNVTLGGFTIKDAVGASFRSPAGVNLNGVSNCNISKNKILNNKYGITIDSSSYNEVKNNIINDSLRYGFRIFSDAYYNTILDNTVNDESFYYFFNASDLIIDGAVLNAEKVSNLGKINLIQCTNMTVKNSIAINNYEFGLFLYNSNNNNIEDCNFSHNTNGGGIQLENSDYNTIKNTIASYNGAYFGVYLDTSSNNIFKNITTSNNDWAGIYVTTGSDNNWVEDCNVVNNPGYGINVRGDNITIKNCNVSFNGLGYYPGIYLNSGNNTVSGNIVNSNLRTGIDLNTANNVVENNIVKGNGYYGIKSYYNGHIIRNNTVSNNTEYGIYVWGSNSSIYNNIFNNTKNYYVSSSYSNTWNTTNTTGTNIIGGNRLGGNAWFWPNGTGYSQGCSDSNGDSFCDHPFVLNANNTDYLPLALTGIDSIPPSVSVISPQNTTYLASTIYINVTATDASGISEVKAQIDGSNLTLNYEEGYYVNSVSLSDGNHWIRIFAEDTAGNINSDEIVYFATTTTVSDCTVISSPGYYHLTDNISNSSYSKCLFINSSDVVFDAHNFLIDGVDTYGTYGIYVGDNSLDNVTVRNVTATDWTYGIYYENSHNGLIENNYLQSNRYGIFLDNSANNTLRNNQMYENIYNFDVDADSPTGFYNNIDTTNLVEGKSIYYLFGASDLVIDSSSNAGLVYCINSHNITVKDSTFTNNKKGIYFLTTTDSRLENNVFTDNDYGICLDSSSDNNIISNNATENYYGYYLYNSTDNLVDSNTALDNGEGIKLLHQCSENIITKNNCSNNGLGIGIGEYEIDYTCYNNTVYLNRLIENGENAQDPTSFNHWNSTSLVSYEYNGTTFSNYTGNYWGDYTGLDNNSDGIGDTPYNIYGGPEGSSAKDYYPMILTFEEAPVITNIQQGNPTNNSVTISWQTNIGSNNRILYSVNQNLSSGLWSEWHNNTLNPEITLTDLEGNTTYYYRVYSYNRDNSDLYSNSSVYNFTTIRDNLVWIVDDDGADCPNANFSKIQDAVNASIDGDSIIVCNGTYKENVLVNKSLNITGVDRPHLDANKTGSGFTLTEGYSVIQGFLITNSTYSGSNLYGTAAGVRIGWTSYSISGGGLYQRSHHGCSNNIVRDNLFVNNSYGVLMVLNSNGNTISGNEFNDGVTIWNAKYNTIADNNFTTGRGIPIIVGYDSTLPYDISLYNRIENNTFNRTLTYASPFIRIDDGFDHNVISGNTMSGYGGVTVNSDNNRIDNNTIIGGEGLPTSLDIGVRLRYANNCVVNNNTIEMKYKGIYIESSSTYISTTNITIKNNRMANNSYHFYIYPPLTVSTNAPTFDYFDHHIDPSNIIVVEGDEKRIYYLVNISNDIIDYDDAGFVACINCQNVTLKSLSLQDNSHGILLYNNTNVTVDNVYTHDNHMAGISVYDSDNVTIKDSWIMNNGREDSEAMGINFGNTVNSKVEDCLIETNWCEGIRLDHSHGNTISNSNITDNGPQYYLKPLYQVCSRGSGIRFMEADKNTVHSNYILATTIPTNGDWTGGQNYGIYMFGAHSNNNTIYNNYFNSSGNAYDRRHDSAQDGGHNFWNITRTPGTNIIGGSYLGGNYWHDYTGADTVGEDGLGDTQVPYNSSGNIINGGDYHPLTALGNDTTPPTMSIVSPVEDKKYGANYVHLKVYSLDSDVDSWWYSLDNKSNVSFTPNTTLTGLSNGQHSVVVYVNDTSGNVNSKMVNFTISVSTGGGGGGGGSGFTVQEPLEEVEEKELEFDITITSPEDKRYTDREITLSYTSSVPLNRVSYILDDSDPVSINPLSSITIQGLTLGEHTLIVNGEEYYGMKGRGEVSFEVIPLALGEVDSAGTPEFPEDVAFSFMGRSVNHKLTLEADVNGEVEVYVNKFLKEENGNKTVEDYTDRGVFIGLINGTGWNSCEFNISADALVPDAENIISFVHVNNSQGADSEQWRIRNLDLMPLTDTQAPQIEVFTLDKSIAEGGELELYVKIDGITNESSFDAYIYLLAPDGTIRYYSDWGEQQTLDPYYLKNNHYGRLPKSLEFEGFSPGTYVIVGKIVEKGDTHPIALSTEKIYYNPQVSTKLYVDQVFTDGDEVIIEHALTPGIETANRTVIISLEDPDHDRLYLPAMSESIWGESYSPLTSEFSTVFTGKVDSSWKNGTYVVRSDIYSDEGDLLAEDMRTFDICRETSKLSGRYIFGSFSSIYLSQIQLIDANTLEIIDKEIEGGHSSYSINAPPGDYYLVGKAYGGDGRVFNIPFTPIAFKCGEEVRRNIILRDTGVTLSDREMEDMGISMSSYDYSSLGDYNSLISSLNSISFQENQDSCSKPKVYLMVGPPWNNSQVDQELVTKYQRMIKQSSTNIRIYSYHDVRNVLAEQEQLLVENPGAEVDFSTAGKMVNADYLLRFTYGTVGSKYVMSSTLLDVDRVQAVQRASTSGSNKDSVLSNLIFSQGDIGATIRAWEMNKLPPRDPIISLTLDPDTVTLEEGKNEATINVRVVDCKGNPVEGARVYFDHITDRGYVKAEGGAELYSSYVYSTTDGNGNADATYLLNKGSKSGKDVVDIFIKARGNKKVHQKATIKIAGIGIEIVPEEEEISPGEDTLIHISLYSENEKGERTPLEGKMILVQTFVRTDSKIEPMGPTFEGTDNPVTDQEGKATLKFIAGKKEGVVKIRALYQGLSYEDSVFDDTWIEVKKEEFVISINWEEYYNFFSDSTYGRFGTKFGVVYGYDFDSKTIWDRRSDREVTDASITFKQKTNLIDKSIYCNCMCAQWNGRECEKPVPYCLRETTTGSSHTSITPKMSNVKTVHTKLREDNAGNLWVYINPVKVKVPLSGNLDGEWHNFWKKEADFNCVCTGFGMVCSYPRGEQGPVWTLIDSESTDGTVTIDYSGKNYYPNPKYFANCIMGKGSDSYRYVDCDYYWGEDFPKGYVKLRKTGENTYGAYHYFWKDKDNIEERIFFGRHSYKYEIHRTFDVTVVRR